MNYLFTFKNISVLALLILQFLVSSSSYACTKYDEYCNKEDLEPLISFMPGQKKCLEYTSEFSKEKYSYFNNLKEFKINKNGKYCLWSTKNWDNECQDVSMQYAYGNNKYAKKLKHIVINFIKYIQNKKYNKALALAHREAVFFTHDDYDVPVKNQSSLPRKLFGHRAYIRLYSGQETNSQDNDEKRNFGDFDIELFRKHLMHIDTRNLKFFLTDTKKNFTYDLAILYQEQNINKYFVISFNFNKSHFGKTIYYPELYDIAIYSTLSD